MFFKKKDKDMNYDVGDYSNQEQVNRKIIELLEKLCLNVFEMNSYIGTEIRKQNSPVPQTKNVIL